MLRLLIAAAFALSFNVTALAQSNSKKIADHIASSVHDGSFLGVVGTVITIGVEAPTAIETNYYVNVMAGYLSYERVEP